MLKTALVEGTPAVLQVAGEIDILSADALTVALEQASSTDPDFVVDMAGVTFFDASGLRVLLKVAASRGAQRPLTLVNAPRVAQILDLVGLDDPSWIVIRDGVESVER